MKIENEESANCQIGSESANVQFNDQLFKPKVSLFIISYNQKDFIAETIESAINQDYENIEIVISDDGSTDGTADIIGQWQVRYPERLIALLNKDNVGITRNCNRALRACSGDFIALVGGDDVLLPGKIAAQVDWFKQDQHRVLCGHPVEVILADGSRSHNSSPSVLSEGFGPEAFIRHQTPLHPASIMVRANAIPPHGFDETIPIASDLLFFIEVLSSEGEYGCVDEVLLKYRIHSNNVSKIKWLEMFGDFERTYLIVADRYPKYREICMNTIVKHLIYYLGVVHLKRGEKLAAREKFMQAIKKKPLYVKAWVRLLQTLYFR